MMIGLINANMIKKLIISLLTPLLIGIYGCKNDPDEVVALTNEKIVPISTTTQVEMLYSDSAVLKARIRAPLRETYMGDEPYIEFTKGIRIEFFNASGKIESELTAKYAISYNNRDVMEARNDVVLKNDKGEKLQTEHLIWEQRTSMIHSEAFTRITTPEKVIYGDGFESTQDFSKYKILKMRGIVNLKE